jgi:hypothetical protein
MKFKTNAMCMGCVAAIRRSISDITNPADWEFDLNSDDKIMSYIGSEPLSNEVADQVENAIRAAGFKISRL